MNKKLLALFFVILSTYNVFSTTIVKAEESQENIKRVSLGIGSGGLLPSLYVNAQYLSPFMDNKTSISTKYAPFISMLEGAPAEELSGDIKYYFYNNSNETVKHYFTVGGGILFRHGKAQTIITGHDSSDFVMPLAFAGLGSDLIIGDTWGLSLEAAACYPYLARFSGSIKIYL